MEKKEKSKLDIAKKILKVIMKLLYQILIIVCVILIIIIVMQRITDSNRSFYGYRLFRIISGSMIPKFNVGEVVICKETPENEIKIGDAIVYRGKIGELNNKLVMHEVVAVNHDEETGALEFYAKGINNTEEDPEVRTDQILGVVKFKSKSLTVLYSLATSIYSSFVIVTILVINVFVSFKTPREQKRPKQLVESETKQNENVKIENDNPDNIKLDNAELNNTEQLNTNKEEVVNKNVEVSNEESVKKEDSINQEQQDAVPKKDRKNNPQTAKQKTQKSTNKDEKNSAYEVKKAKNAKKENVEISEKKAEEKTGEEKKKISNKKVKNDK